MDDADAPRGAAAGGAGPVDALLAMPWSARTAQALGEALGLAVLPVECHRFPDGETRVALPAALPARVALFASLDDPDARLARLMLAAETARELGVAKLTLVAPYLCYMRQDIAFRPGEAVSQRIVGRFLARLFDAVITVDPHLHRVARLQDAVPAARAVALSAAGEIGRLVVERFAAASPPLLLGPDAESAQWVQAAARPGGLEFAVCTKARSGDRNVTVRLPEVRMRGRAVVIVDDVASTGHTLADATRRVRDAGAVSVDVAVTHALFVEDALPRLHAAGVDRVWSTDSVEHPTNAIRLAPLLAAALR